MISFIVAMGENRVIGRENRLPWHLPEDMKYFKQTTMGHPVIMGRKTFESIGRPLPGRKNIILTKNKDYRPEGCTVFNSVDNLLEHCLKHPEEEFFVIGGGEIFEKLFPYADRIYMTFIFHAFDGDAFFPPLNPGEWTLASTRPGTKDEKNPYVYEFRVYERK